MRLVHPASPDETTLQVIVQLVRVHRTLQRPDEAKRLAERATRLAAQVGPSRASAEAYEILGSLFYQAKNHGEALANLERALAISRAVRALDLLAKVNNNLGTVYSVLGKYDQAAAHYLEALKINEQSGSSSEIAAN
jgi:tetratricopeptide (TPR) repeat protein